MNGLCGAITEQQRQETFLRLSKLHPRWSQARIQQRTMVEVYLSEPAQPELPLVLRQQEELFKNQGGYVDCGDCPRISTGCFVKCDKAS